MLKLMIAEDEALERKSLRFLLTKHFHEKITITAEAANGREIVQKALEHKPDIILMDIHMPEMDGLEAAIFIKKELPNVEILILTAYSYFDYAQTAIRIGVSDYLVKPYSREKFCDAIHQLISKVTKEKSKAIEEEKLYKQINILGNFLEKEFILQLIHGNDNKDLQHYKEFLDIKNEKYTCLIIRTEASINREEILLKNIKNQFKNIVAEVFGYVFLKDVVLFMFDSNLEQIITNSQFAKALDSIKRQLTDKNVAEIKIGLGEVNNDFTKLRVSYVQAKEALISDLKSNEINRNFIQQIYDKELVLCEQVINEDYHGAIKQLDNIFHSWLTHQQNHPQNLVDYVKQLITLINRSVMKFFGSNEDLTNSLTIMDQINQDLNNLKDVTEAKVYLNGLIKDVITKISQHKKDRNQKMIDVVKGYIEKKFMEPELSLNEVANHIGISSFYLSKCFKKIEGINFKEYLIKVRINKAKRLMREEGKNVQEAAFTVGYTDPNYFSKAFKKYVGLSPKQYTDR
ncbi:MAG: response regulator [Bacillota bacterium]|nr:response regulator [Bacillota bacterium]